MSRRPPPARRERVHGVGTAHLTLRQVLTDRLAVATVALVVLVCALLAAAVPRALDTVHTDGLRQAVTDASPQQRDLTVAQLAAPPSQPGEDPLAPTRRFAEQLRDGLPPSVRALTAPPVVTAGYRDLGGASVDPVLAPPRGVLDWDVVTLVDLDPHVRWVDGRAPATATTSPVEGAESGPRPAGGFQEDPASYERTVVEVAVSARTADDAGVAPGSRVDLPGNLDLLVVGVFEAVDPTAPRWGWDGDVLEPPVVVSPAVGDIYQPVAVVAASTWPAVERQVAWTRRPSTRFTVPVTDPDVRARGAAPLLADVRAVEERLVAVPDPPDTGFVPVLREVRLGTNLDLLLAGHLHAQAASTALVTLLVTGLAGTSLGLLALAARLVVERRRRALALAVARGASPGQVRALMTVEGLLLGLPAAAVGAAIATALVPGDPGPAVWVLPALLGLAPAVLLPLLARPGGLHVVRRDVTAVRTRRVRVAAEVLVVLLAVAAVLLLRDRGLDGGGFRVVGGVVALTSADRLPWTGPDPLLAAAPVLVALAAALLTARWYPRPVAALADATARRRGAVAFLGAARAGRDPGGGTVPLVVLVLALSTAVFGSVLATTSTQGATTAAWQQLGAPARVSGAGFTADEVAAAVADPDVRAAAATGSQGATARTDGRERAVTLAAVDAGPLADVQRDLPRRVAGGAGLDRLADASADATRPTGPAGAPRPPVPALTSAALGDVGDEVVVDAGPSPVTVRVVATLPGGRGLPGLVTDRPVVVVDRAAWLATGVDLPVADAVALAPRPGADVAALQERLRTALGTAAPLTTHDGAVARVRDRPLVAGTLAATTVAAVLAALVSGVAVVLALVVGAPERTRLLSRLRTLGADQRQARWLVVWEVAPLVAAATAAGAVVGLLSAWALVPATDLRAFTGGAEQPAVSADPLALAGVLGGFVLVTAALVAVAVAANRRLRLGAVLRVGDET
ncbi:FtsX-like permease family protein [Thalassiella azotivora]